MKKIHLALLTFVCINACTNVPKRDCKNFRTGTYSFTTMINGEARTTKFTRDDKIEVEKFGEKIDTAIVRWINDCEYILKKINAKGKAEEKSIHIKILKTSDSSYTFEYNAVGSPQKLKGEAIKIY